jgi:hypothetical protein
VQSHAIEWSSEVLSYKLKYCVQFGYVKGTPNDCNSKLNKASEIVLKIKSQLRGCLLMHELSRLLTSCNKITKENNYDK